LVKWEYRYVLLRRPDLDEDRQREELDSLGADGWEAVGMAADAAAEGNVGDHGSTYGLWVLMKRPRP